MAKPKKRPIHESETGDGDFAASHGNTEFSKEVRSKMGEDGVEETHVTYKHRKKSTASYSFPGQTRRG